MHTEPTHTSSREHLWEQLARVQRLSFVAKSALATGWNGAGQGAVGVIAPETSVWLFQETGTWQPDGGPVLPFRNVFRWTKRGATIRLEHLRFGPDTPVWLFDLIPHADGSWRAADPHQCGADQYDACLTMQQHGFDLTWHITGPKKQERIAYRYRW